LRIHYLGNPISGEGIIVDPMKVEAIMEFPTLTNVLEVCSFIGLTGYYQCSFEGFSKITHPIMEFHQKNKKFVWNHKYVEEFQGIKELFTISPILKVPYMEKEFLLCTYASKEGLGRVLMKDG
jgi:hypothetical protein